MVRCAAGVVAVVMKLTVSGRCRSCDCAVGVMMMVLSML